MRGLRTQSDELKKQAGEINDQLTEPQRLSLDAAHLIVDRKNFSWSHHFADLETTLPQGVRVSRITVRDINGSGAHVRAELELAVVARSPTDVTDMMGQMARSGIFSADLLTQQPAPKGEAGIEATLRVRYAPVSRPAPDNARDNTAARAALSTDVARASATTEAGR
ncbi:MAG: hypothetical protein QOF61_3243 [Acidobacteriota bacterium]|nr:hypothetical protein [Acidobacteriota bacterium]